MGAVKSRISLRRDYFEMRALPGAVERAGLAAVSGGSLVLELQPRTGAATELRPEDARAPTIAFPRGALALVSLLTRPADTVGMQSAIDVLLPRSAFDHVADHFGARRINSLSLCPGAGRDDAVLDHLGASLGHATAAQPANAALIGDLALALNLHVAQRYGRMEPLKPGSRGGLASWQLRLARKRLDQHLDSDISLDALAAECGLSPSHFTRAFSSSTGLTPHRWLMHRRIEAAKDLILRSDLPLAQIALACGFSDQSHFTRVFSSLIGLTPARWRQAQEQVWAVEGGPMACG